MIEFESYKKEADKIIRALGKRNDIVSQLTRLRIREKLVTLSPKVETVTNDESIIFVGLNENGEIESSNDSGQIMLDSYKLEKRD